MRKIIPFTMVELILALGVCAIGLCSIMVLIPVGANATRDAALETYAASAAEQLLHFLEYQLKEDGWNLADLPTAKPNLDDEYYANMIWPQEGDEEEEEEEDDEASESVFDNILLPENADGDDIHGVYKLHIVRGEDEEITVDFQAILLVWSSRIIEDVPSDLGVRLNVEVSWPAEIPYAARQRALYCLAVFNPNYNRGQETP